MSPRKRFIARRQAKRWAYEEHADAMCKLPMEIRDNIDWAEVARDRGIEDDEPSCTSIYADIQRLVDYLYEDEASDYQDVEHYLKPGHIFDSVMAVQRWLYRRRT